MVCETIRPIVRRFLDDLLDEKDYRETQAHLAGCAKCRQYASSVGTLSYRLHEMGQITLPPDMISTILYQVKRMPPKFESPPVYPKFSETSSGAFNVTVTWAVGCAPIARYSRSERKRLAIDMVASSYSQTRSPGMPPPSVPIRSM